jgi:hypothetical protein
MAGAGKVVTLKPRDRVSIVDEFGRLDTELAGFKPRIARHEQLRKQIQSWYDEENAEHSFLAEGKEYVLEVTARANERKILSMAEVKRRLGLARFLKLCKFPLGVLDEIIPPAEQSPLVSIERTGNRSVRVIPKYSGATAA